MVRVALKTMRCGPFLAMLALLLGAAPALAQDSPGIIPMPKQSDAQPAKKHARPKAATAKPAEAKAVTPKPAAAESAASKPAAPKAAAVKAEPAPDVFAGIPPGERLKIQAALLWSGDYTGAVAGEDPMLAAIKNYQKRSKAKVTGVLTPAERAALRRRGQDARGRIRLERGGRPGHRHPHRPADQDGAACARRRARHALVVGAWRGAGRDLPHQGSRAQARRAVRAAEEGAGRRARSKTACCTTTISSSAACRA